MRVYKYLGLLIFGLLMLNGCRWKDLGIKNKVNKEWQFLKIDESVTSEEGFETLDYNDEKWETVNLPHTPNFEPKVVEDQWQGVCWYRKSYKIPKILEGRKVFVEFEAAMNYAQIWINGQKVSDHHGGYLPLVLDLTAYLKIGKKNTIAVRLDNNDNEVTGPKPLKILDFNTYGGLYRNVWLTVKDKLYISEPAIADKPAGGGVFITFPEISKEKAIIEVKTNIVNERRSNENVQIINTIFFDGKVITKHKSQPMMINALKKTDIYGVITVSNPALWSPQKPHLYTLQTIVLIDGQQVDQQTNRFGIRDLEFKENQLYINGEKTFLRGVNRHQEYPYVGYAISDEAQYRDAKKIKDAGFNYIRLSHYPQSPAFLDACDELGLLVTDAILGWQYYKEDERFKEYCYNSARQLIRRDRNHACVLNWEVSLNETKMPIAFMEELNKIVHEEYPGKNVYSCGWLPDVYDIYFQARQHRILHGYHPEEITKPYSVSEYGDWEYFSNNAGLNQDKLDKTARKELSSRQLRTDGEKAMLVQANNLVESHNDNLGTLAFGDSYWVMFDYNRGNKKNIESSGLMDIFRLPKFGNYFYKSQKDVDEEIVLELATYWDDKSPLDVKVYSNCEEVALYLNDVLVATQKPDENKNTTNLNHPPFTFNIDAFESGTLKAVGLISGDSVKEVLVKTPGKAVEFKVWFDESGKKVKSGNGDTVFLRIAAVDKNGTIVPNYNEPIALSIIGNAEVLNEGEFKAEAGIATALLKMGDEPGNLEITAISNNVVARQNFTIE